MYAPISTCCCCCSCYSVRGMCSNCLPTAKTSWPCQQYIHWCCSLSSVVSQVLQLLHTMIQTQSVDSGESTAATIQHSTFNGCCTELSYFSKPVVKRPLHRRPPVLRDQCWRDKELHFSLNTTWVKRPFWRHHGVVAEDRLYCISTIIRQYKTISDKCTLSYYYWHVQNSTQC